MSLERALSSYHKPPKSRPAVTAALPLLEELPSQQITGAMSPTGGQGWVAGQARQVGTVPAHFAWAILRGA